ncbi:LysR family transcriptional regulator [Sphingobium vermicomposti]|uniref:DNA-binding transcriptional LysR family regulator n=1 Tax=Sphingobium vermicomposti TaxID=529005 RepID=A0A846M4N1_9SPHN|nr:LysR family transcriptional regulator [Sphingobium vermicomposti]NIJ15531.1 DNA-binding transcriptional LysR family regulator [Sphingobium vermicomposti]
MATSSLRQLDIFAQIVASGNAALCARDLGISVEKVAQDLASLEMRLGYRLFDEISGDLRLTAAGRKTAEAMTLLSQGDPENWSASKADEPEAQPASQDERQSIVLAAPAPVFGRFQEALAAFEAANEDVAITLDLTIHLAEEAAAALREGRVDIAYFYALGEAADLPSRYGWSEQINLYAGNDHPLALKDSVSAQDLATLPMLMMERPNPLRRIIDAALAREGIRTGDPVLETDNMFDVMTILREGAGCFAAFGPLARDLGRLGGIRRLALERSLPAVEVRQAIGSRAADGSAATALADYLFL